MCGMSQQQFEVLSDRRDTLGEGPWWDAQASVLYWVDIFGHAIRAATLDGAELPVVATPSEPGFVVKTSGGNLVTGLREGLYERNETDATWRERWRGEWDTSAVRVNDGKTDRSGRLWFGTMHDQETDPVGALYVLAGNEVRQVDDGIKVSNGLGWSPDSSIMYYADSPTQVIMAFDFDAAGGTATNPRVFATDPGQYQPDGLTVDADGCVWSAKWDGSRVVRYTPAGAIDKQIMLPASRPTSCMFVGSDLRTLAVTSAAADVPSAEPLGGALFLLDVKAQGLAEAPCVI